MSLPQTKDQPAAPPSLIAELESSLKGGSSAQCGNMLRRVIDLFLSNAESYTLDHIKLFDDVICHLIEKIEREAKIELSNRLAPIDAAPMGAIRRLSRNDDIAISKSVLQKSNVLTDDDLIDIASTKSQDHLAAIAERVRIAAAVTDILIERGNAEVTRRVTVNPGAEISRRGFGIIAHRAEDDASIAVVFVQRRDVPPELFDELLRKATAVVRKRLLDISASETHERVSQAVAAAARRVAQSETSRTIAGARGGKAKPRDLTLLKTRVSQAAKGGTASETMIALAELCEVSVKAIKNLVHQDSDEGVVILGKAVGLGWTDVKDVLAATMPHKIKSKPDETVIFEKYIGLSAANAQRILQLIRSSKAIYKDEIVKLM
jgi:uncharacterized protein (DUF2336 family)